MQFTLNDFILTFDFMILDEFLIQEFHIVVLYLGYIF